MKNLRDKETLVWVPISEESKQREGLGGKLIKNAALDSLPSAIKVSLSVPTEQGGHLSWGRFVSFVQGDRESMDPSHTASFSSNFNPK